MRNKPFYFLFFLIGMTCTISSCTRNNDAWENTKSAGRHMQRGFRALGGKHGDSRQVRCRTDFECIEDNDPCYPGNQFQDCDYQDSYPVSADQEYYEDQYSQAITSPSENDFIPINDPTNELAMADMIAPPPREIPGEPGSSLPSIQAFRDPSTIPRLATIFRPIYFAYNSSLIKGPQNLKTIHDIADFLRSYPNVYIFIEGHTDERGPQVYNLALGSRRANAVRNFLIKEGIHPDRLFTISYGKERPVVLEQHEEGWSKNRRAEFKIYER